MTHDGTRKQYFVVLAHQSNITYIDVSSLSPGKMRQGRPDSQDTTVDSIDAPVRAATQIIHPWAQALGAPSLQPAPLLLPASSCTHLWTEIPGANRPAWAKALLLTRLPVFLFSGKLGQR